MKNIGINNFELNKLLIIAFILFLIFDRIFNYLLSYKYYTSNNFFSDYLSKNKYIFRLFELLGK